VVVQMRRDREEADGDTGVWGRVEVDAEVA
jgi:hypothetical protein